MKGSRAYNPGSTGNTFGIKFDDASLRDFTDFCVNRTPKEATRLLRATYGRIGTKLVKDVKRESYSHRSGNSLGVGTGYKTLYTGGEVIPGTGTHGKYYGHVRDNVYRKHGAIGFGAYVRTKIKRDGKWKARINEVGSGARYARRWRGNQLLKPRYLGGLPARAPWGAAAGNISPAQITAMTADAVSKAIKAASRKRG